MSTGPRGEVQTAAPTSAQRTVARRAAESRATIPHLELGAEVDVERSLARCDRDGISLTAVLARACALALRDHPRANGAYRDGQFELYSRVNVGLVLHSAEELVAATLFDADSQSLAALTQKIADLDARANALTAPERAGATFTLAHHSLGLSWEAPLVWSGQAAALAAGAVREAAVVREGKVVPGRMMSVVLACDHRILYGPLAARLLARIKELLEHGAL